MRSIQKPTFKALFTFTLCVNNRREPGLRLRMLAIAAQIDSAELIYEQRGENATLFEIPQESTVSNIVSSTEMESLYTGTFSRLGSLSRYIYDKIKVSAKHGVCPLCAHRIVSTLDHYLAKSLHPIYAVTPLNLIPACSDCNKSKLAWQPVTAEDQTLHPYFDEIDDDVWLKASVVETHPPMLEFYVNPAASWSETKRGRVYLHFKTFGLKQLYSANAAQELVQISYGLNKIFKFCGSNGVQLHLIELAESRNATVRNSWQAAMYTALAESQWFCNEGHKNI